jgi:uncharacterized LabA/DUF88 family protein
MRTIVYVDGYNLYYGRITGTSYKWLDLPALFQGILSVQDPASVLLHVKYFTAPALAKFARRGNVSSEAQTTYHRALESKYSGVVPTFSIIKGRHDPVEDYAPLVIPGKQPDKNKRVLVWKIVEKKTDINLAMAMYRDAANGIVDQLVLCTNDSDAEPALEAIRQDFPHVQIGLVTPRAPDPRGQRVVSKSLAQYANWTRHHILDQELEQAQLRPTVAAKSGKVFRKPAHWGPDDSTPRIYKQSIRERFALWLLRI